MKMESSTSGNETCYPPDVKAGFEELCPVCGDKVSGYHYGLLTCESCKGFFKRTVQNKKVYSCVDNRSCHIDKSQRKRCPYCRFQKCLSVGMKLEAVRSDRMRGGRNKFGPMYKRDRAIKQQAVRQQQHILSQCSLHLPNGIPSLPPSPEDSHHSPQESTRHVTSSPVHSYSLSSSSNIPAITSHTSNTNHSNHTESGGGGGSFTVTGPLSAYPHPMRSHDPYIISHAFPSTIEALRAYPPTALSSHQPFTPVVPPLVADLKSGLSEESEVKNKLLNFMQSEFGQFNINNPDKFLHILCKLVDQLLFLMVEWARSSIFFKDMRVEDQMKLLQNSWSEILFLDFVYRQVHDCWGSEIVLENGQKINLDILDKLGLGDLKTRLLELIKKTKEVNLDIHEYACLKFIILLNPDVSGLENREYVEESQERVNASLLEYCLSFYPDVKDKFGQILLRLPEIRLISIRAEEYMYYKHMMGDVPDQTLLMEMLHSKKK